MKGGIPRDRDRRSKGTKMEKSIFGERVCHPLEGLRGLKAEGEAGVCREEIRWAGLGPSVSCPHMLSSQDPVQQLWIIPGRKVALNSSSGSSTVASGWGPPPVDPCTPRDPPACVWLEVGEGLAAAQRPG